MQWYGGAVSEFQTVWKSLMSLSSMFVGGSAQFIEEATISRAPSGVVLTTSLAVVTLLFYAAVLATLVHHYTGVRRTIFHYSPTDARDDEMIGFLAKQLKNWLGITKPKPV